MFRTSGQRGSFADIHPQDQGSGAQALSSASLLTSDTLKQLKSLGYIQ